MRTTTGVMGSGLAMLGGIGVGLAAMYLLDPDRGPRRRRYLSRALSRTLQGAGQSLGSTWQNIAEQAQDWRQGVAKSARKVSSSDIAESAGEYFPRVRSMFKSRREKQIQRGANVAMVACGAMAIGAGLMYIFDPQAGRRRRALIRDKFFHLANRTSDSLKKTSQYVTDHAKGMAAAAKSRFNWEAESDEQLTKRIRSKIGHAVRHPRAITVNVHDRNVILSGAILASDVETLLSAVRSVPGVNNLENQLNVHQSAENAPELQG